MCKKVTIVQITLKFIPTFTDQTYILLTHCIPVRLSRNSHIWYPGWRRHHVLIKYSQKYNFFVFVFNLTEVETAALKIFCVMIPSLVYTCRDFGLFRVVRPYVCIGCAFKRGCDSKGVPVSWFWWRLRVIELPKEWANKWLIGERTNGRAQERAEHGQANMAHHLQRQKSVSRRLGAKGSYLTLVRVADRIL